MKHDVVIVGAGLAGLTAARYLQSADLDVVVLEGSDRPGGRVKSDYIDGFVLDHGFQVINPKYPEVVATDLIRHCEFRSLPAGFRIVDGDNEKRLTISTAFSAPGSLKEKIALLGFLNSRVSGNQNLGDAATRFPVLFANVLEPFLRGVFLTEPATVSSSAAQKILRSFISGRPGLPAHGVGIFSTLLAGMIPSIQYETLVQEVQDGFVLTNSGKIEADFIIVATDPTTAHQLIHGRSVPEMLPSQTWYHVTSGSLESSDLLAVQKSGAVINSLVLSELLPSYAPAGSTLLSSTTLASVSESDVRRELAKIWKVSTHDWQLLAKYEIKQSLPFHNPGKALYSKQHIEGGLYIAGDHCTYPSQQGAMESGRIAAEEIIRRVEPTRR